MSTPQTHPLARLLASHPSEVADALARLCARAPHRGILGREVFGVDLAVINALFTAGIATEEGGVYFLGRGADRYAIARMGAAAWLAARVAPCG